MSPPTWAGVAAGRLGRHEECGRGYEDPCGAEEVFGKGKIFSGGFLNSDLPGLGAGLLEKEDPHCLRPKPRWGYLSEMCMWAGWLKGPALELVL